MHRLFVSITPDPDIVAAVQPLLQGIDGARWTPPDQWHITLRFVGSANSDRMEELAAVLSTVRFSPFPLDLHGVGTFPAFRADKRMNVLWLGLQENDALDRLIADVEDIVLMTGFAPADRPTYPHLTIARLKDANSADVARWLDNQAEFEGPRWEVRSIELMDSYIHQHETAAHAEYSTICSVPAR
ncbi:MAG: RNA 2',3'-cyclic phosphodiesterase [Candidatus Kapaibacteriota bacterium]